MLPNSSELFLARMLCGHLKRNVKSADAATVAFADAATVAMWATEGALKEWASEAPEKPRLLVGNPKGQLKKKEL